jgi:hypothetical protein
VGSYSDFKKWFLYSEKTTYQESSCIPAKNVYRYLVYRYLVNAERNTGSNVTGGQ